jgi:hypothetical protein
MSSHIIKLCFIFVHKQAFYRAGSCICGFTTIQDKTQLNHRESKEETHKIFQDLTTIYIYICSLSY